MYMTNSKQIFDSSHIHGVLLSVQKNTGIVSKNEKQSTILALTLKQFAI